VNAKPVLTACNTPATVFVTSGYIGRRDGFWTDRLAALLLCDELPVAHLDVELGGARLLVDVHTERARERAYRYLHHRLSALAPGAIDDALATLLAAAGTTPAVAPSALPLDVAQLRELARDDLITIGAHSVTHPRLTSLDEPGQRMEMTQSQRGLEDLLARRVRSFAYPYGSRDAINDTSIEIARELYDLAVTTEPAPVVATTDAHRIPRFNVGNWPEDEFTARLTSWLDS
jgi:peptidoglycan/xylan/chitin deacetylase (PgdA/CDA1 family)